MENSVRKAKVVFIYNVLIFIALTLLQFIALELFFGQFISDFSILLILKNILLMGVCNLILVSLSWRLGITFILTSIFFMIAGIANYFVNLFRGYGIVYMDFYAAKTAATVAGHYTFKIGGYFCAGLLVYVLCIIICVILIKKRKKRVQNVTISKKKQIMFSVFGIAVSAMFIAWINLDVVFFRGVDTLKWDHAIGIHNYGYPLYFIANAGTETVDIPIGYSAEKVDEILSRYSENENTDVSEKHSNLIMIMDESYSDLRVLGEINVDKSPWEFVDSLTKNTIKGFAVSSVYGGYTANSEFEFLTGATKVFLPGNPYLQYVTSPLNSIITDFKANKEYKDVVAMHPYNASGYNRNRVYPLFSFDTFLALEEFDDAECIRGYVSDKADFRKIMELYEQKKEGEKLCVFNVTIQNHNPYDDKKYVPKNPVHMYSSVESSEEDQYLSLSRETDIAIEELIEYFNKVSEPTVILIFGDHQPHLPDEFYEEVTGKVPLGMTAEDSIRKNFVPYIIWANYDVGKMFSGNDEIIFRSAGKDLNENPDANTTADFSLNYLRLIYKKAAGFKYSDYDRFLLDLSKEFPVISAKGCIDVEGKLYQADELEGEQKERLREYEMVQYYYLFDKDNTEKIRNHFIP